MWIWGVIIGLALGLVGLAGYRVWPILHPSIEELASPDAGCDLNARACIARFPGGEVARFQILPNRIPVSRQLELTVALVGVDASSVQVDFVGVDMDMGFNRVRLAKSGADQFKGAGMLPICVRGRMLWEARVLIDTPKGLWAAPFRFETSRD